MVSDPAATVDEHECDDDMEARVKISEVIARMQAVAQQLPEGLDSEGGTCRAPRRLQSGADGVFEIDSLVEVSTTDGSVHSAVAIIKSHPHSGPAAGSVAASL